MRVSTVLVWFLSSTLVRSEDACSVFCQGTLLDSMQLSGLFNDSKTFVDLALKRDANEVIAEWNQLTQDGSDSRRTSNISFLEWFLDSNFFSDRNSEASPQTRDWQACVPPDFDSAQSQAAMASLIRGISDPSLKHFAEQVYRIWPDLCKSVTQRVYDFPDRTSMMAPMHRQMIVAGGRFREMYYWDSYFILRGLIESGLNESAVMLFENVVQFTLHHGFMPNGNRIYYKHRSQPPLLFAMVGLFEQYSRSLKISNKKVELHSSFSLESVARALQKELDYWMSDSDSHSQFVQWMNLNLNNVSGQLGPRPESYCEDVRFAMDPRNESIWGSLRSAAQSGWDFSSRWCSDRWCSSDLSNIDTRHVIPVDLNVFLFGLETKLSQLWSQLGRSEEARSLALFASRRLQSINSFLWDEDCACFRDWNVSAHSRILGARTAAQIAPALWILPLSEERAKAMLGRLISEEDDWQDSLLRIGGVVTTLSEDSQQWDWPNAWPPLHYMLVYGAQRYRNASDPSLAALATAVVRNVSQSLISAAWKGFNETGVIREKYSASQPGQSGSGGEYTPQTGFGWTNGVILSLLSDYGDWLTV